MLDTTQTGKNIIIFCDGTGNEFGVKRRETNVVKLLECLERNSFQSYFYDPGVGTLSGYAFGRLARLRMGIRKLMGLGLGYGFSENIEQAYRFLMNQYEPGDRVFLFGFSRGAYTLRALSGIIARLGLLRPGLENLIPIAQRLYFSRTRDQEQCRRFRQTFSRDVTIHLIGVWDTVAAIGIYNILGDELPKDRSVPDCVRHVRHAVAIDETRWAYRPRLYDDQNAERYGRLRQLYFAGVHSDVGGSYAEAGLSNVALQWMAKEAATLGLAVDAGRLAAFTENPKGTAHSEVKGWKKFWFFTGLPGIQWRRIEPGACVHESVRDRIDRTAYAPANLPESVRYVT